MAYGELKVDSITFTNGGTDTTVSVSGLVQNPTFSGDITVTGTISGDVILGGTTVSGATVTGSAGEFGTVTGNTAGFTTITGTSITGSAGQFGTVTGNTAGFTTVTGTTVTGTTANFVTVSGTTVTGDAAEFTSITGGTAGFTTVTGTTVTGTTANFNTVSGTTVTGGTGNFTSISATTTTITSGVFASGTAAAPSVSVGTTDNGLYSPGTDQVAISTNGTGRLFVDASGNVGIKGTPTYALDVQGTDAALRLKGTANTGFIADQAADGLVSLINYDSGAALRFGTNSTERLRITSTGELKHIGGGSEGSPGVYFAGSAPSNSLYVQATTGNVGLGNSTPGSYNGAADDLVVGNHTGAHGVTICSQNNSGGYIMFADGTTGPEAYSGQITYDHTNNRLTFGTTDGTTGLTIDSSQRVGIGTTSPTRQFQVENSSGNAVAAIVSGTSSSSFLLLGDTADDNVGQIGYSNTDNALFFDTNGSERARIDSSGRLLVGTSTNTLNIKDDDKQAIVYTGNAGQGGLSITGYSGTSFPAEAAPRLNLQRSRGTTDGSMTTVAANDLLGKIDFCGADGTDFEVAARIAAFVDGTPGSNDMPGRLVFSTTADGASSPTERMRITNAGSILSFADTSNDGITSGIQSGAGATPYLFAGVHSRTGTASGGTLSYSVAANGDVLNTNNSYGPLSSDERLKQDIIDAGSQWDDIKAIRVAKFRYKNDPIGELQLGPIAQELEQVSPGLITRRPASEDEIADPSNDLVDGDEILSFKASILYMKAVKALQEAMERIETLEAKVAALEGQ